VQRQHWDRHLCPTVEIDPARLEQQGLSLAQEAAQLAQFQRMALLAGTAGNQLAPKVSSHGSCWGLCKRISLTGDRSLQQARSLQPKASILFALGETNSTRKVQRGDSKFQAGLKLKPNDPEGL